MRFDIGIIGAGVLGVCIAFWLSELYNCKIAVFEREEHPAFHTSSRNTGVIHRPFYLDPEKKKVFARSAEKSYSMWSKLASVYGLSWKNAGTIEVATRDSDLNTLEKYKQWSLANGMSENESDILDSSEVSRLEPEVRCKGAFFSKSDASVDYAQFVATVAELAQRNGAEFLWRAEAKLIEETSGEVKVTKSDGEVVSCGFLVNASGGKALDLAHSLGVARNYANLHFRGEYWLVDEPFASKVGKNIYSIPRHKEFPFLDPHFVVRASGKREIGPNAVLVSGPFTYRGLSNNRRELAQTIFERPRSPKAHLFTNSTFLSLIFGEWRSSLSKKAMCARVKKFIPRLESNMLAKRGVAGVRSSLIDGKGFVPEVHLIHGERSVHILNYNSPGATGAPSFSAYVVSNVQHAGLLDNLKENSRQQHSDLWNYEEASSLDKI